MPVFYSEIIENNFIDKHFQDMLYPLDLVMRILFIKKYNSQDGFVTPNDRVQKFKSLLLNCVLVVLVYIRFRSSILFEYMTEATGIVKAMLYIDLVYYSVALSCLCITNLINTNKNAKLVLNLQKACNNFHHIRKDFKRLTYWNWVSMIMIPVYFIFFMVITYNSEIISIVLNFLPFVYFDLSLMYVIRVIWIIKEELKMWVNEMQRCAGMLQPPNEFLPRGRKLLESYCFILDAFGLFKKVSPFLIALQLMEITSRAVLYLQVHIVMKKEQMAETTVAQYMAQPLQVSLSIWMCKNYLLVCLVCYSVGKFYSQVQQTEEICDAALKSDIPDIRHLCKNIRRCNKARFDYLRVCGIRVDACLPLLLVGVLTTYSAVVLQFNLNSRV